MNRPVCLCVASVMDVYSLCFTVYYYLVLCDFVQLVYIVRLTEEENMGCMFCTVNEVKLIRHWFTF